MGRSRDEKTASHERILEVAAARIRAEGTARPGVADVMRAAGLTHGGFYKHFGSRDELVAEAAEHAFAERFAAAEAVVADAGDPLAAFVGWYASAGHRDDPAGGCAVVSLGPDAARGSERLQAAYRAQVERYLELLERLLGGGPDVRSRASVALSALVGAVLVARALGDEPRSDELLRDVRRAVGQRPTA